MEILVFGLLVIAAFLFIIALWRGDEIDDLTYELDRALTAGEKAVAQRDKASADLAAAIKERDEAKRDGNEWFDRAMNGWACTGDRLRLANGLIGDIAELIERYDAETCGEGE